MAEKLLFVDDDPNVLAALRRQLRREWTIETAESGAAALELLAENGPFAVIIADMRMPRMDGIEFLDRARQHCPDSIRIMLTGNADQQTAADAVNRGRIFRFLTKPCPPDVLGEALHAALRQHELVTAEKHLLEKTLRGSIGVLTEVLALTNPTAFGHATRVLRTVQKLARHLDIQPAWQCEVAAMLSQIGCVTLPAELLERAYRDEDLTPREAEMVAAHPAIARKLVAAIPRLEPVAEIIGLQRETPDDVTPGRDARVLRAALDFDALTWSGVSPAEACARLARDEARYGTDVLDALRQVLGVAEAFELREIPLDQFAPGMTLADDLRTPEGALLARKGQEVTLSMKQRLRNYAVNGRIRGPFWVLVRTTPQPAATT